MPWDMYVCAHVRTTAVSSDFQDVPKDPFVDPYGFLKSITAFATPKVHHGHVHTLSLPHHFVASNAGMYLTSSAPPSPQAVFLTRPIVESISGAYDKAKQSESYKVHRVLINKLDDLATDLRTNPDPGGAGKGLFGWASSLKPTTDLDKFVRAISQNAKSGCASLRYLWSGRPSEVERKRKEKEAVLSEEEEKEREKGMEREKEREMKEVCAFNTPSAIVVHEPSHSCYVIENDNNSAIRKISF